MILNIILILLLINSVLGFIFKPQKDVLYCGIWGWSGRSPKSFNREKFNILGILNETRGKDSCGVSVDGENFHGVNTAKIFRDFLKEKSYPNPEKMPIVIGHTRATSVGTKTIENAHPFGFGESKKFEGSYAFVGMHNGTLYNHDILAKRHGVDNKATVITNTSQYPRYKIDSEILLEIIYHTQSFKVLSEYNGLAALAFIKVDEPEYLYLYHGVSADDLLLKKPNYFVERPLFVYQEHKNSLYFSSQENGLIAIGGTEKTITNVKPNIVYKIKNGNFATAEEFPVSRRNMQHKRIYNVDIPKLVRKSKETPKKGAPKLSFDESLVNAYHVKSVKTDNVEAKSTGKGGQSSPSRDFRPKDRDITSSDFNIYHDTRVSKDDKKVNFTKLRYWRNGHLLNGIYTWIPTFGFFELATDLKSAEKVFYNIVGHEFIEGDGFVYDKNRVQPGQKVFIPFPGVAGFKELVNPMEHFHYFYDGIRIKTYSDYKTAHELRQSNKEFGIQPLSDISAHPIMDLKYDYRDSKSQGIMLNSVLCTDVIAPLGSEKIYYINKGNLYYHEIIDASNHRSPYSNLELVINELETNEDEIIATENGPVTNEHGQLSIVHSLGEIEELLISEEELADKNDELDTIIDEAFMPVIEKFQGTRDQLSLFKDNPKGQEALKMLNNFLKESGNLVAMEISKN